MLKSNGTEARRRDPLHDIEATLNALPASGVANLCMLETENRGADVGQWLRQLSAAPAGSRPSAVSGKSRDFRAFWRSE